ncbi:MAG: 6-carboxytetrahydropterin synthase QueD [Finegoldia sp.]|nr:6-carboxytetrahydropterin synthase QueD [Finegoldia sp.]
MYYIEKRMEIAGAHRLELDYESPCTNLHGHNWIIKVYCKAEELDRNGMVVDFKRIKEKVAKRLDHQYINDIINVNPTAENIAKWVCDQVGEKCYKVSVQESEGNLAIYER